MMRGPVNNSSPNRNSIKDGLAPLSPVRTPLRPSKNELLKSLKKKRTGRTIAVTEESLSNLHLQDAKDELENN